MNGKSDAVKQHPARPDSPIHRAPHRPLLFRLLNSCRLSSFLLRLFVGPMATDGTTSRSTQNTVPTSNVTSNAAYSCTFEAPLGLHILRNKCKSTNERKSKEGCFHNLFYELI